MTACPDNTSTMKYISLSTDMLGRQYLNPNVLQANLCLEFVFETFNNFGYGLMASDTAHKFEAI